MKVIDLLNKIAKGEEVPKEVKYKTHYWKYNEARNDYVDGDEDNVFSCSNYDIVNMLDKEVQVIEEVEEDEFEDIEEINNAYYHESQDKINQMFKLTINDLIKNQKKIIEQLKNKD